MANLFVVMYDDQYRAKEVMKELKALKELPDLADRMLVVEKAIKFEMMQHKISDAE